MNLREANSSSIGIGDLGKKTALIINAALDAIICMDTSGSIILWNPQAEEIFGWRKEEIVGKQLSTTIIPERFRAMHHQGLQRYLETGVGSILNKKMEITALRNDGSEFPIELSILPINEDGDEFFCAFIRDITDRKQAEFVLRQQKEFSESIINSLPGMFYLFDSNERFLLWNKNVERITEYTAAEVQEMSPLDFFYEDEKPLIKEKIVYVFSTKTETDIEANLLCKNGDKIPFYFTGKYLEVDGRPCLIGMGINITERMRLQEDLDKERKKHLQFMTRAVIAAQEAERGQLGQELHDNVNQVLTTVKLYNEMILSGIADQYEITTKSISLLQLCIDEIRSISKRLSAPSLGNITLQESIKELVESLNLTKRINIIYSIEGSVNRGISHEIHLALYRIVQEQLTNIFKYSEASFATVSIQRQGDNIKLIIRDDGKGFEIKERYTGMGITNMRTRAENLNGNFLIQSSPGKGCYLAVEIPTP